MSRASSLVTLALVTSAMLASCGGAAPPNAPIALPPVEAQPTPPKEQAVPAPLAELPALPIRPFSASEQAELEELNTKLSTADKEQREVLIDELELQFGGRGLVRALAEVQAEISSTETEATRRWFRTKQLLDRLLELADPSCADDLHAWWAQSRHEHWKGRAAAILASLGDPRGAAGLARRMRYESEDLYQRDNWWQADAGGHLSRTDRPRIVAARLLADLAVLHPARRRQLRATAEQAVLAWMLNRPQPHANAMRFLALTDSAQGARQLARWATPSEALPDVGAQPPFPMAFEVAQSALRYYGASGRDGAYKSLTTQLRRKPHDLDISQEALMGAGLAMRGMALRALAYGAAEGLAELGDERAYEALARLAADKSHHEEAREVACRAIVWCTSAVDRLQVAQSVVSHVRSGDPASIQRAHCLATGLANRPTQNLGQPLVSALELAKDDDLRRLLGAVLVGSGATAVENRLIALLDDDDTRATAAAVLMLGGSPDAARRAAKTAADDPKAQDSIYFVATNIGPVDEHLEAGTFDRWAENWRAYGKESPWPIASLQGFMNNVRFDRGPHTMTRVVWRRRLVDRALRGNHRQRSDARTLLELMGERGALWYLARHSVSAASGDGKEPAHGD